MDLPFESILPLISMLFVIALGIFVYFQNRKSKLNTLFGLFSVVLSVWFFGTFRMFTSQTDTEAIFWDRFIYAGVVFVPALLYHFSVAFTQIKGKGKILILSYFLSFLFLLISRTDYFVSGLFEYAWGVHTQAKLFHHLFLFEVLFFFYLALKYFYQYYQRKTLTRIERRQAKFVFLAFFILIVVSLPAFAPAYEISVYPFFYFSGLIFSVILAYAILKHNLMNIRVLATEFFVGVIAFVLLVEFFLAESFAGALFQLGVFVAFCFLGWQLIKSVLREIKRRTELQRLYREVDRLSKSKSEFISIASHQLRTPLTAIKGYISMIMEGSYGKLEEKVKQPMENVYQSNERLIKLVNDLLNLSRLDAGKIKFEPEPASLEEMVLGIVGELRINATKKGLDIKVEKPSAPLPEIMIDRDKMRQVILNLVDNAIKYTKEGRITVEIKKLDSKEQVEISDTGAGMTEKEIGGLFQMFSRATAGTKLHTEGAGVGLYVAKKFIDMHNGKIWAESKGKGKGSTFFVELPIK